MSIVQVGPQGYEFQYLATCLIGLNNMNESQPRLLVEQEDGEDAEMRFSASCGSQVIEIQAKSSLEDVGLVELAGFLTHFTPRKADQNLLGRILSDKLMASRPLCF